MNKLNANEICVLIPNHLLGDEEVLDQKVIDIIRALGKLGWVPCDFGEDNGNCTELWFDIANSNDYVIDATEMAESFIRSGGWD